MKRFSRREFIKGSAIGVATIGLGGEIFFPGEAAAQKTESLLEQVIPCEPGERMRCDRHICTPAFDKIEEAVVSPDGKRVFVIKKRQTNLQNEVVVYNAESASEWRRFQGGQDIAVSAQGNIVAYETMYTRNALRTAGSIEVVDMRTSPLRPRPFEPENNTTAYTDPRLSGDGSRLVTRAHSWRRGEPDRLYLHNLAEPGVAPKHLSQAVESAIGGPFLIAYPDISSDGRFVVFVAVELGAHLCIWDDKNERLKIVHNVMGLNQLFVSDYGGIAWTFATKDEGVRGIGYVDINTALEAEEDTEEKSAGTTIKIPGRGAKPVLLDPQFVSVSEVAGIADDGETLLFMGYKKSDIKNFAPYILNYQDKEYHQIIPTDGETVRFADSLSFSALSPDGKRVFLKCKTDEGKEQIQFFEQSKK